MADDLADSIAHEVEEVVESAMESDTFAVGVSLGDGSTSDNTLAGYESISSSSSSASTTDWVLMIVTADRVGEGGLRTDQ
jgi:hypothetical protein